MQETWVRFLGQEDPLEKGMVTAWRIPQTAVYGVTKSLTLSLFTSELSWYCGCVI